MTTESLKKFDISFTSNALSLDLGDGEQLALDQEYEELLVQMTERMGDFELPWYLIGSVGIAATCNLPWDPYKFINGTKVKRDIDVLVFGSDHEKEEVREALGEISELFDVPHLFGSNIQKDDAENYLLQLDDAVLHMDSLLFEPTTIKFNHVEVYGLHPQVYLEMLHAYNPYPNRKMALRERDLEKFLASGEIEALNEDLFTSMHEMRKILSRNPYLFLQYINDRLKAVKIYENMVSWSKVLIPSLFSWYLDGVRSENDK